MRSSFLLLYFLSKRINVLWTGIFISEISPINDAVYVKICKYILADRQ